MQKQQIGLEVYYLLFYTNSFTMSHAISGSGLRPVARVCETRLRRQWIWNRRRR